MRKYIFILVIIIALPLYANENDKSGSTLIKVGQQVPKFSFVTISGDSVNIRNVEAEIILLNFFATWCPPCLQEMPKLESDIWEKYKDRGLKVYCIGREHTKSELKKFAAKNNYSLPMVPDPERQIYAKFAEKYIPRNIIIDKEGKIILQEIGFNKEKYKTLKETIIKNLQN